MYDLDSLLLKAKNAKPVLARMGTDEKNSTLLNVAEKLVRSKDEIIKANKIDLANAEEAGMSKALLDRLKLTDERIAGIADGVREVAALPDPIGEVLSMWKRPNGLTIGQKRVPMGVIGIIYESRPNVTVDSFALTFKAGNACILRGGSDCINSNIAIVKVIKEALSESGVTLDAINLVEDTDREIVNQLMKANGFVDVLIPRGGAGLIQNVINNATVPVIETGTGNCHIKILQRMPYLL